MPNNSRLHAIRSASIGHALTVVPTSWPPATHCCSVMLHTFRSPLFVKRRLLPTSHVFGAILLSHVLAYPSGFLNTQTFDRNAFA